MSDQPVKNSGVLNEEKAVRGFFKCILGDRLESFEKMSLKGRYQVEFEIVEADNLDLIRSRFKIIKIIGTMEEGLAKIWVKADR